MQDQKDSSFESLQQKIIDALKAREKLLGLPNEPLNIIGMANIPLQDSLNGFQLGGKSLPIVIVVGEKSGRVYQFAIKALLPDLGI